MGGWLETNCVFSECRRYRYRLVRIWSNYGAMLENRPHRSCNFLMLNPSTADEQKNDPTVERCERFARRWGYDSLVVTNIFAYRATDPKEMRAQDDPVGEDNDKHLLDTTLASDIVICAWGAHGAFRDRSRIVHELLYPHQQKLHALALTKAGEPRHPLYLKGDLEPFRIIQRHSA